MVRLSDGSLKLIETYKNEINGFGDKLVDLYHFFVDNEPVLNRQGFHLHEAKEIVLALAIGKYKSEELTLRKLSGGSYKYNFGIAIKDQAGSHYSLINVETRFRDMTKPMVYNLPEAQLRDKAKGAWKNYLKTDVTSFVWVDIEDLIIEAIETAPIFKM